MAESSAGIIEISPIPDFVQLHFASFFQPNPA